MSNMKTTIVGVLLAILQVYVNDMSWKSFAQAGLMAALGFLAKDFNVTGNGATATTDQRVVMPKVSDTTSAPVVNPPRL